MLVRCTRCFEEFESAGMTDMCGRCCEEEARSRSARLSAVRLFGRYEILGEVNRGAMGIIYKAREQKLGRIVALKVLIAGEHASDEQVGRFIREAKAIARLRHPNIVPVHDVGEVDGRHYFTMDFIEGEPLSRQIAQNRVEPRRALDIIECVADGLECAHQAGVVHRDIKPSNIMIDREGRPLITDFGLAKPVDSGTRYTRSGTTLGTPAYMPPEQARGEVDGIDARSDVYSIGAVLYEMVTGSPPFDADNMVEVILSVIHDDPLAPRKRNPRLNADIQNIILRAMEKEPSRRYGSAAEFADDIRRYKAGEAIVARGPGFLRFIGHWGSRHKGPLAVAGASALVFGLGWLFVRDLQRRMEESAREARLSESRLEQMLQSDRPVWMRMWEEPAPRPDSQGWTRRPGLFGGMDEIRPVGREPFLGSVRVTGEVTVDPSAPEDAVFAWGLVSTQDPNASVPFYGVMGKGRIALYGLEDVEASGAAGTTGRDLRPLVERNAPKLRPGASYLVMIERRGIDVRFQVVGPDIEESLSVRNAGFSNWRAKNLHPALVQTGNVTWKGLQADKLISGKSDTFDNADSLFFIGEYNGAQSIYSAIVDSKRPPHRVDAARLRLGMCAEVKGEHEQAVGWYRSVEAQREDDEVLAEARLGEVMALLRLGRGPEAARRFMALGGLPKGPNHWLAAEMAERFLSNGLPNLAAEVVRATAPHRGWMRMERAAVAAAEALAAQGRLPEVQTLADAAPEADISGAFTSLVAFLLDRQPDQALAVLDEAVKRYPGRRSGFIPHAVSVAEKFISQGRHIDVTRVYDTLPSSEVAGVFAQAVDGAASEGRFEEAMAILSFARSRSSESPPALTKAAVNTASRLRGEGRYADIRRVYGSFPHESLYGEVVLAIQGMITAGDSDQALSFLEYARRVLGPERDDLSEAAAMLSQAFASAATPEAVGRVADSIASYPGRGHLPFALEAMDRLAAWGRPLDAVSVYAALRSRLDGGHEMQEKLVEVMEKITDRRLSARAFSILSGISPVMEFDTDGRVSWLVEFGDVALSAATLPGRAEDLYREAYSTEMLSSRRRIGGVAAGRLAVLLEAAGRREEATRLWESMLENAGTAPALQEAARAVLGSSGIDDLARWQADHPADMTAGEVALYAGISALRQGDRDRAVAAFRRVREGTRGRRWPYHILGRLGS